MRLPQIDPSAMDAAQKVVHDRIAGGARGAVRGPFLPLLHSPELAGRVEQLGVYVRYECAVPQRLRELAILIVARHWQADYEWFAHAPLAENQGIPKEALEALGKGQPPQWQDDADAAVAKFCADLLETRRTSDETYQRVRDLLGIRGTTDLVGLVGYYSLLALTLNAHEVDVPAGAAIPWHASRQGVPGERQ